jgi:hypothetical protein
VTSVSPSLTVSDATDLGRNVLYFHVDGKRCFQNTLVLAFQHEESKQNAWV